MGLFDCDMVLDWLNALVFLTVMFGAPYLMFYLLLTEQFNRKRSVKMKVLSLMLTLLLLGSALSIDLYAGTDKPGTNMKYSIDVKQQRCHDASTDPALNGHPAFLLDANGQKFQNPNYCPSGKCCWPGPQATGSPWQKDAAPYCYDQTKPEYYGCAFNN